MLNVQQAINALRKTYPKRQITQAIDYDSKWFLFLAVENPDRVDFDSPYYAVDKQTGAVRSYSPVDDLEKFTDAVYTRQIKL